MRSRSRDFTLQHHVCILCTLKQASIKLVKAFFKFSLQPSAGSDSLSVSISNKDFSNPITVIKVEMASDDSNINDYIQQKWLELNENVEKKVEEKWWNILKSRYSEENRKYHTLLHLKRMFDHMESVINEIQNKDAVSYAVFFHDVVYDARSQDNEEQSIKLFNEFASESGISKDQELVAKVEELIMASKAHCTEEHKTEGLYGKDDMHYFLDFDVSILGSDEAEYKKYNLQIREEYSFLPKPKYNFLRSKVLRLFLQIPNIYATQAFREKYEKQARSNILNEIESLNAEN